MSKKLLILAIAFVLTFAAATALVYSNATVMENETLAHKAYRYGIGLGPPVTLVAVATGVKCSSAVKRHIPAFKKIKNFGHWIGKRIAYLKTGIEKFYLYVGFELTTIH